MNRDFESTHPAFLQRLDASKKAVDVVANWARMQGRSVRVSEVKSAPTRSVAFLYSDKGDLLVDGKPHEVKCLSVEFHSIEDWPYEEHFIVDGKGTYDKKRPKPRRYLILDSSLSTAAVVDVEATRDQWEIQKRYDRNTGREQEFYLCPVDLVTFYKIPQEARWDR